MTSKACDCCGSTGVKLVERKGDLVCQFCNKLLSFLPKASKGPLSEEAIVATFLGPIVSMIGFTGNWIASGKGDMEKQELLTANRGLQSLLLTMYRDAEKFARPRGIGIDEIFSKEVLSNFEIRQEMQNGLPQ